MASGLAGLMGMLGGGALPSFPCALCTTIVRTMRKDYPVQMTTTVVAGTPVCDAHVLTMLEALGVDPRAVYTADRFEGFEPGDFE